MLYNAIQDGRINDPIIIKISPEVILWHTTLFSTLNANSIETEIGSDLNTLVKTINVRDRQSEILVLEKIPIIFFNDINPLN